MKNSVKAFLALIVITTVIFGYTLSAGTTGPTRGTISFPTPTSVEYTHDGTEIGLTMVLDSFQIKATDVAGNVGPDAWMYVKITPVDNQAPVIASDTLVCPEGGSVIFTPSVSDADTN